MVQKRGRGVGITVKELMDSTRLKIAVKNFDSDPLLLRAIITELCLEVFVATKNSLTRIVGKAYGEGWKDENGNVMGRGMDGFEMIPYLRGLDIDDVLNNMNIWWGLSPQEAALYSEDPKFELSPAKRAELFERVKKRFNMV